MFDVKFAGTRCAPSGWKLDVCVCRDSGWIGAVGGKHSPLVGTIRICEVNIKIEVVCLGLAMS